MTTTYRRALLLLAAGVAVLTACGGQSVNRGVVSDATLAPAQDTAKPAAETPTWGKRYTWDSGLAVEIAPPVPCKPGEFAVSSTQDIQRAVKFTITIINGTTEAIEADTLLIGSDAQFNGRKSDEIYDSGGECGSGSQGGTVLPGKSFTTEAAFAVGPQSGEMQIALQPLISGDKAVYVGPA